MINLNLPTLGSWLAALALAGCSSLPLKPDPAHSYFDHPDQFAEVNDPALYVRPLRVRYKEAGPPDGPPLLLVHGLQTSSYSWRYNLDALAAKGRRVIAVDLVGSGLTDHPADFGYSPERMAQFLDALRRTLGIERWDVVGNSLGGVYSAVFAARYPDRIGRLVVIHAPGFMDEAPVFGVEQLRRGRVPRFFSVFFGPWMVRDYLFYHRPNLLSEEEVEQYSLPYRDAEGKAAFWHIMTEGISPEVAPQLEPELRKIRAPTLLIWAEQDPLIPAWTGHRWEQAIAGSRLEWIPQSSHFPHVEAPATTHRLVLAFLEEGEAPLPPASTVAEPAAPAPTQSRESPPAEPAAIPDSPAESPASPAIPPAR